MRSLVRHHWPGNVRELQNYIARGVILSNDGVFEPPPLESYQPAEPEISNPTLEDKVRIEILLPANAPIGSSDVREEQPPDSA